MWSKGTAAATQLTDEERITLQTGAAFFTNKTVTGGNARGPFSEFSRGTKLVFGYSRCETVLAVTDQSAEKLVSDYAKMQVNWIGEDSCG